MGNIRADTNNMRNDFEAAASHLVEVDPYRRSTCHAQSNRSANVSAVSFAGRGKTGVDLRWHTRQEFRDLSNEQRDELMEWQNTSDGKKAIEKQKKNSFGGGRKRRADGQSSRPQGESWKRKFKKAIGTQSGLSHVMSVLRDEESSSTGLISALQPAPLPPAPTAAPGPATSVTAPPTNASIAALASAFPALSTKVKLNGILKPSGSKFKKNSD